ncbi:MAG TPA: hypothetical protein VGL70_04500 [Candidatus Binatia bacterium]|jgi:hypothetical protein
MSVAVKIIPGKLPPFWDRSVLFFCNIHSIFYENKEEAGELMRQLTGAQSYGGRVMSILNLLFRRGPNRILLEAPPETSLLDYLSIDLRLSLPGFEVLDHRGYRELAAKGESGARPAIEKLRSQPASWVDGFVTDAVLAQIAGKLQKRTISTLTGSKNGNNKYLLYRHQVEKQLPTFDTLMAANPGELSSCLKGLRELGYAKGVVKAQIGASGYGMVKLATQELRPDSVPDYLFFEGPCMVQGWLDQETPGVDRIGSPSVQMFLNDDTVYLYDWTEQVLSDESIHEGNRSPPPYIPDHPELEDELFRQAGIVGEWLHAQGYRGTASADFLVIGREGKTKTIVCEINARITGATYPAVLARHFMPEGCWSMRNIQFRGSLEGSQLLSLMDRASVLYRPGMEKGIVPFNFNTDAEGKVNKGQFLCLGQNQEECAELLVQGWAELPVEWGYDRD